MKKECFGNDQVILHEIDIRNKAGDFAGITKEQQKNFFEELGKLFSDNDFFSVLAVSVNIDDLDNLYKEDDRNDIYNIALQLLMENFAQFLPANDGIGTIYLETTDAVNNKRLQNLFHLLKATRIIRKQYSFLYSPSSFGRHSLLQSYNHTDIRVL